MYLDPGFGSMLIQLVVASIAAAAVGLGIFRQRIKAFFSKNKNQEAVEEESTDEAGEESVDEVEEATEESTDGAEEASTKEAGEDSDDR